MTDTILIMLCTIIPVLAGVALGFYMSRSDKRSDCMHHDWETGKSSIHRVTVDANAILVCLACGKKWRRG